ncbi:transglycosylase SLT domain-containing protein [Streptomyces sp. NPDC093225]|uniref:golvesin C-terminal-like domain-containing protein n=1 Tax=Streptomyces sp. NPDC093225 TaxID=3366034 RepID=UPI0037F51DB5
MRSTRGGQPPIPLAALLTGTLALALAVGAGTSQAVTNPQTAAPPAAQATQPLQEPLGSPQVPPADRDAVTGTGWRISGDRAWTTSSDAEGFHILVADKRDGYTWRTAATLAEPGFDADAWIGNACVTASGQRAVAVYAPRTFTNSPRLMTRGAFTAVVDLNSGKVTKLPKQSSLAYFSPGCGRGERAVVSQFTDDSATTPETRLVTIDALRGTTGTPLKVAGQVTSAVPFQDGIAAADGFRLVKIDSRGTRTVLASTGQVPFQLRADSDGGLVFLEGHGDDAMVKRWTRPGLATLATGRLTDIDLTASASGTVFVTGKAKQVGILPRAVKNPGAAKDATATTFGQALVASRWADKAPTGDGSLRPLTVQVTTLATGRTAAMTVSPSDALQAAQGKALSPALTPPRARTATGSPTNPVESERTCAVPRSDVHKQAMQPTPRQVEWAVDQAVINGLNKWINRPANWNNTGIKPYQPQKLFPLRVLAGDPNGKIDHADDWHIPAQILLGVTAQESNMWQATRYAVPGLTANSLIGNYYGIGYSADGSQGDPWAINWAKADCGYGITQVTDGMRKSDSRLSTVQKEAVALDYTANIAAGADILAEKWNQLRNSGLILNDGNPKYMENWFFALWAYNSGFHLKSEAPSNAGKWGLGWTNNPANPLWKENRNPFLEGVNGGDKYSDAATPQYWPYPEKVIGWAARPPSAMFKVGDFQPGYRAAWWATTADRTDAKPRTSTFCTKDNDCNPSKISEGASNKTGQGPCTLPGDPSESDPLYLKCWWHGKAKWKDCRGGQCGNPVHRFDSTYPEQPNENSSYPPRCTPGLPAGASGALIVDDVPDGVTPAGHPGRSRPGSCGKVSSAGTFGFKFASWNGTYPGKIDLHQIGAGYGNHFWFTHTQQASSRFDRLQVTGTWTLGKSVNGWMRVLVHIPDHGAHTRQAKYRVIGSDSTSSERVLPQRIRKNTWVSLGAFRFKGSRPQVSLSNRTGDGTGDEDIAWDSVAFVPLPGKPKVSMVAMGDSYASGEGASEGNRDYYPETNYLDKLARGTRNACHRSKLAWARQVTLPGMSKSVGSLDDKLDASMDYHMPACSGALTSDILTDTNYNERPQIDQGYLDNNTTLVTISIGGNDARFSYVVSRCALDRSCKGTLFENKKDIEGEEKFQGKPMKEAIPGLITDVVARDIRLVIENIHAKAPNAKIVLMGYPRVLPEDDGVCMPIFSLSERAWLGQVADHLATTMDGVARSLRTGPEKINVVFGDPRSAFRGKDVCGNPQTIHGAVKDLTDSDLPLVDWPLLRDAQFGWSAQSFHPNIAGAGVYAGVLRSALSK